MNHGTWTPLMESLHGPAKARNEPDPTKVASDAVERSHGQASHAPPTLRPYQVQAVDATIEGLVDHRAALIVAGTGLGKTVIAAELIRRFLPLGRVMFIADRKELLLQAQKKIHRTTGVLFDIEMGESYACRGMFKSPGVLSSIQSQRSGRNSKRWEGFDPDEFSLLFIDETDLAMANSYREMIDWYFKNPRLKLAGCTATPDRHDEKDLGEIYGQNVVFDYPMQTGIAEGWLVPIVQKYLMVDVDLDGVKYALGDFDKKQLREALAEGKTIEKIASDTIQYAKARRTLVFSDSIENAERMTVAFNAHELGCARIVTGETEDGERADLFDDYDNGRFQYLVNVGVCGRGLDIDGIGCIVQARPLTSEPLYKQQLGRGTRPLDGLVDPWPSIGERRAAIAVSEKPNCLVLDVVGNSKKHTLASCATALGEGRSERVVMEARRIMRASPVPCDVAEAIERAERTCNAELLSEAAARDRLKLRSKSKSRDMDPFQIYGLARRERRGWEPNEPPDDVQRAKLEKWGVKGIEKLDYSGAAQIIETYQNRARQNLCTIKQASLLKRYGHEPDVSFDEAHAIIDAIAARGWTKR